MKGVGEGNIDVAVECGGKTTKIQLTNVMHVPGAEGKILSLKVLAQRGFESHMLADHIHILRNNKTHAEALLGGEIYKVNMKVIPSQVNVLATVKRDDTATDLYTWHQRLGHLGDTTLKKLVRSDTVKGMEVTSTQLVGICRDCIFGKMDERPFENRSEHDSQMLGTLHADLIGPMTLETQWSHAKVQLGNTQ